MSLVTIGTKGRTKGRAYQRAFDHEEALALREADPAKWTCAALAAHFDVSRSAVQRVLNPATRERMAANSAAWTRENCRAPCKGGCGTPVWTHMPGRSGYCPACIGAQRTADAVRDDELLCRTCGEWKPDGAFGAHGPESRRGRKSYCRACEAEARRALRQGRLEYERAFDRARKRDQREVAS